MTENRAAFMPWLLWSFDRQRYPHKELVIVDSSPVPFEARRPDVRVIPARPGSWVPAKRNTALCAARGELIAWFDDDDWQHPERLTQLARGLEHASVAGPSEAWFIDLLTLRCRRYRGFGRIIFNGAGFRAAAVEPIPFDERRRRASDTPWLSSVLRNHRGEVQQLAEPNLTLWLCHARNISNPSHRHDFPHPLDRLQSELGPGWGDTHDHLTALRSGLEIHPPSPLDTQRPTAARPTRRATPHGRRNADDRTLTERPRMTLIRRAR